MTSLLPLKRMSCIGLALALVACGNDHNGQYIPDPQTDAEIVQAPETTDAPAPDIPDLSDIVLDDPESLVVKLISPATPSFASSSFSGTFAPEGGIEPFAIVGGLVLGDYDEVSIQTDAAQDPIVVTPDEAGRFNQMVKLRPPVYHNSGLFEAQPTQVRVVARKGERIAWDAAVAVANPGFHFPQPLRVAPDVVYGGTQAGETTELTFSLDLNEVENFVPEEVWLMEVDSTCTTKVSGSASQLRDDGDLDANGDIIPRDRVYSQYIKTQSGKHLTAGTHYFRASVRTSVQGQDLIAYTPCVAVRVVERVTAVQCETARGILDDAQAEMDAALAKGWPLDDARRAAVVYLLSQGAVAQAGASAHGDQVWAMFHSGLAGGVFPSDAAPGPGVPLFAEAGAQPAIFVDPTSRLVSQLIPATQEEGTPAAPGPWTELLSTLSCPPLRPLAQLSPLAQARALAQVGLIFWAARGGEVFGTLDASLRAAGGHAWPGQEPPEPVFGGWEHAGAQQVVWLEDSLNCQALQSGYERCRFDLTEQCLLDSGAPCPDDRECIVTHALDGVPRGILYDRNQADLASNRLILGPGKALGVMPSFVARYGQGRLNGSLAFLGFPRSALGGAMLAEFLAGGANAVIVTRAQTDPAEAEEVGARLLETLLEENWTAAQLLPALGAAFGDHDWRLAGAGNVDIARSGLLNASFEQGNLKGWQREGDARTMVSWCGVAPTNKYMAMISNRAGFGLQAGSISQEFCLAPDQLVFEAWYDFISHEFMGSCGFGANDRFEMYLEDETGERVYLARTTNDNFVGLEALCPCDAGSCGACSECGSPACPCGELYHPDQGKTLTQWPLECSFDPLALEEPTLGQAWASGWRHTGEVALTALGQGGLDKPIRLVIQVRDSQSKLGNTAVLVDSIQLK